MSAVEKKVKKGGEMPAGAGGISSTAAGQVINSKGNVAFVHRLKCWAESFDAIVEGAKRCEVRAEEDRKFLAGDVLQLTRTDRKGDETKPLTYLMIEVMHVDRYAGPLEIRGANRDDAGGLAAPTPLAVLSLAHRFERHTYEEPKFTPGAGPQEPAAKVTS